MSSTSIERDVVLFLGAGFSHAAGLPLMSEFGEKSRSVYRDCRSERRMKRRRLGRYYRRAGAVFRKFQQMLRRAAASVSVHHNNMETVFCAAESYRQAEPAQTPGRPILRSYGRPYTADEVYREMQVWLFKMYQENPLGPTWRRTAYAKLIRTLKENALGRRTTVLTTNYDLVFESFAWRKGLKCRYGLPNSSRIAVGGDGDHNETYLADDSDAAPPLVCKLHGSINYFTNPDSPDPDRLLICDDVHPTGKRLTDASNVILRGTSRPRVLNFDAVARLRNSFGRNMTPQIIPPTYAKLEAFKWLKCIWNNAFEALRSAKKIVFIGYSMPESDGHMRAMIQAAMAQRTAGDSPGVHVFDLSTEALLRYQSFFGPLGLRMGRHLWQVPFEEAVNERLPEILTN